MIQYTKHIKINFLVSNNMDNRLLQNVCSEVNDLTLKTKSLDNDGATPLENAVSENDYKKVYYLLRIGSTIFPFKKNICTHIIRRRQTAVYRAFVQFQKIVCELMTIMNDLKLIEKNDYDKINQWLAEDKVNIKFYRGYNENFVHFVDIWEILDKVINLLLLSTNNNTSVNDDQFKSKLSEYHINLKIIKLILNQQTFEIFNFYFHKSVSAELNEEQLIEKVNTLYTQYNKCQIVDINYCSFKDFTVLMLVCQSTYKEYISLVHKMIFKLNANPNILNYYQESALLYAIELNYIDIANILISRTNSEIINMPRFEYTSFTPLYYAILTNDAQLINLLVEKGAVYNKLCRGTQIIIFNHKKELSKDIFDDSFPIDSAINIAIKYNSQLFKDLIIIWFHQIFLSKNKLRKNLVFDISFVLALFCLI